MRYNITMNLKQIYERCGLKDSDEHRKKIIDRAIFSGLPEIYKDVVEKGRRTGKTTSIMMNAIKNLYDGKTTVIWVMSLGMVGCCHRNFLRYANMFPDLVIEVEKNGEFVASFVAGKPKVMFIANYNRIPQKDLKGVEWDEEYDDTK